MNRWIRYNAWSALIQKNYDMVEVLEFNGEKTNKELNDYKNPCMNMDNTRHKNDTGIFRNHTKTFIDGKKQNSTIWCYYTNKPGIKVNKPKGNMDILVSEISNDKAIKNISTKSKFLPGQYHLISQLELERMTEQAEKRARRRDDADFPSDTRTILGPEFPEDSIIWWISLEARNLFNTDSDETDI